MSDKPKKSDAAGKKPSIHSKRKTKPDGTKEPRMRKRTGSDFAPERPPRRNFSDSDERNTRSSSRFEKSADRPARSTRPSFGKEEDRPHRSNAAGYERKSERGDKKDFDFKKRVSGSDDRAGRTPGRPAFGRDNDRAPRKSVEFKKSTSRETRNEDNNDRSTRSPRPASSRDGARTPRKSVEFNKSTSRDTRSDDNKDRPSRSPRPSFSRDEERPRRRSTFDSEGSSDRGSKKDIDFKKRSSAPREDKKNSRSFGRETKNDDREPRQSYGRERNEDSGTSSFGFGAKSSRGRQSFGSDQSSRGKSREGDFNKGFTRRNSTKEDVPAFKVTRTKGKEREVIWSAENEEQSTGTVRKYYRDEKVIRLNRYIANAGICSRREADTLIQAGTVTINGKVVTEMGAKVGPDDVVVYGGQRLSREKLVYVLLNKPKDYVTTMRDPQGRKTVDQLVKGACRERIVPVGRLDRETSGLLLMTNDGDMAKKLTHPKHGVLKLYHVHTDKKVSAEHLRQLLEGITLEDGPAKADKAAFVGDSQREVGLEIHMGRNRIVRRMFESLGYKVVKLDRVIFAGLTKKDLPRGRWRYLTDMEVSKLKMVQ